MSVKERLAIYIGGLVIAIEIFFAVKTLTGNDIAATLLGLSSYVLISTLLGIFLMMFKIKKYLEEKEN